jgi:hypothetical protein
MVYVKKGRLLRKHSIKYDRGQFMTSTEDTVEPANENDEDEHSVEGDKDKDEIYSPDRDSDTKSCDEDGKIKRQMSILRSTFLFPNLWQNITKKCGSRPTQLFQPGNFETAFHMEILALTLVDLF